MASNGVHGGRPDGAWDPDLVNLIIALFTLSVNGQTGIVENQRLAVAMAKELTATVVGFDARLKRIEEALGIVAKGDSDDNDTQTEGEYIA